MPAPPAGVIQLGCLLLRQPTVVPVPLEARDFEAHTAVVAQSGSGKSFFLGRLVEELLLKSSCRIVILDPNSDFLRIDKTDESAWTTAYVKRWFPEGDTSEVFSKRWSEISKKVLTNRPIENAVPISVLWSSLTEREATVLLDIDPGENPGEYWFLVAALAISGTQSPGRFSFFDFEASAKLLAEVQQGSKTPPPSLETDAIRRFQTMTAAEDIATFLAKLRRLAELSIWGSREPAQPAAAGKPAESEDLRSLIEGKFFSEVEDCRLLVIDLQSLDNLQEQQIVTSLVLDAAWDWARRTQAKRLEDPTGPWEKKRFPVYLVVDEAHNVAPAKNPSLGIVHERIVKIATEGRKYDLFLIASTQSPRQLDSTLLSQCGNVCLLRTTSEADLRNLADVVGHPPMEIAKLSFGFQRGDFILSGSSFGYPLVLHCFPRRSAQGGGSPPPA